MSGQAATCTEDGWKDYYKCSTCGAYFEDSGCTTLISDIETWKTGAGKVVKGHDWRYSATGDTITASCSRKATCNEADKTLKITATTVPYSSGAYTGASISDTSAWVSAGCAAVPTIMYNGIDPTSYTSSETPPTAAGRYKATITVNGKTAAAPFAITGAAIACYTEVTLTATPNSGYRFKQWVVSGGAITITNNKFVMPDCDVTVKAVFEKIPDSSSGGSSGGGSSSDSGTTSEVTTSKDAASNTATTTSPTEVKVENKTASATVKAVNMIDAIRQEI